jgi:putative phosphoesterase
MKFLILSDTHGNYPLAVRAIEQTGRVDRIIHLGDEMEDARIIEKIVGRPVIKVPGNCDLDATAPRELCKTIAHKRIFLTHGDRYNVKAGLTQLHKKALEERAQIVLFGHSHLAAIETIDGILFINPGSLQSFRTTPTYAVLSIAPDGISAQIVPFSGD